MTAGRISGARYRALLAPRSPAAREARALLRRRIDVPLLALSGAQDGCMDTRLFDAALQRRWLTNLVVERLHGVGHFMHLEDPRCIGERIVAWLGEHR